MDSLLRNLPILTEQQLRESTKDQLSVIFNQIHSIKSKLDQENMNLKIQLETKQNELNSILSKIKDDFGVSSIEDLKNLKEIKINQLASLGLQLQSKVNGRDVVNEQ